LRYERYPRYVATKAAFHLLGMKWVYVDMDELRMLKDRKLEVEAPLALNSMIFRLNSLLEFYHNFETTLYIAKRFHMKELRMNHFDF
jgi:hypothetical protein